MKLQVVLSLLLVASVYAQDLNGDGIEDSNETPDDIVCMPKVLMVNETVWENQMKCHHIAQKNCYEVYKTVYAQAEIEECDEKFRKDCFINYKDVATSETVQICSEELKRDCDVEGEQICETRYQSVCETAFKQYNVSESMPNCQDIQQEECMVNDQGMKWCFNVTRQECNLMNINSRKVVPKTECNSVPKEVCGPEKCPIVPGEKKCRDEVKHLIQEVPEEECNMVPQKVCQNVTKIVPNLMPQQECIDVPKEVCVNVRVNPKTISKPVMKKWCGKRRLVTGALGNGTEPQFVPAESNETV